MNQLVFSLFSRASRGSFKLVAAALLSASCLLTAQGQVSVTGSLYSYPGDGAPVADAPTVSFSSLVLGRDGQAGVMVVGQGGEATVSSYLYVGAINGSYGSNGVVSISGGTLYAPSVWMTMTSYSDSPYAASGTLSITDGGTLFTSELSVGRWKNCTSTITISNGTIKYINATSSTMVIGGTGSGTVHLQNGLVDLQTVYVGGQYSSGSASGTAVMTVSGGLLTTSGLVLGSVGTGEFYMNGGTTNVGGSVNVGNNRNGTLSVMAGTFTQAVSTYSYFTVGGNDGSAAVTFSNKADLIALSNLQVNSNGAMTLKLEGGNADFSGAVLTVDRLITSASAQMIIDLSDYAATEDKILDLMYVTNLSGSEGDISWVIEGLGSQYEIDGTGAYWDGNTLKIGINYIPEPSVSAALLGLLGVALAARRRK